MSTSDDDVTIPLHGHESPELAAPSFLPTTRSGREAHRQGRGNKQHADRRIKLADREMLKRPGAVERFQREIRAAM